jgi:cytochrome b pre-mRNA-processing protein 3
MTFWKRFWGSTQADPKLQLLPLYNQIVAKAREPHWYETGQVPDSIDGRFDMIATLFSLVLLRLETEPLQAGNMAHLTEVLVDDMDGQLREVGIGDMIVGKHIGKIMGSVGGKITAFRDALADKGQLDDTIARNLYRGEAVDISAAVHVRQSLLTIEQALSEIAPNDLAAGNALW